MIFAQGLLKRRLMVIVCALGLAFLLIADTVLVEGFRREQSYRERVTAERLKAQMQATLEEHVTALIALKVVYQNFTDINHYDFQQYGHSITATLPAFQRLFFIDPALTIRQAYPLTPENRGLYGYAMPANSTIAKALRHAKNSPSPTTSRLIPFLNHPRSFWAFIPIYRNNKDFLGFAAGEISLERIWQKLSHSVIGYQAQLIDPDGITLFPHINFIKAENTDILALPFNLAEGDRWTLLLKPIHPLSHSLLALRSLLWLGGLLILFLIGKIVGGRQKHEADMEQARRQFQTIVEASPDGILLLDDKLRLKVSNAVVRDWLGQKEEALADRTFFELFECQCPNLDKCGELSHLLCTSKKFAADLPDVLETRILNPPSTEGTPKTLRLNASRIFQERNGHREAGFICVLGDISTSKELERIKETYVATLTHDLKTPLLAQQMVLETLVSGVPGIVNDEQRRLLTGARESVQDLVDMVNSTLLFYKLESAHVTLHRQRTNIVAMVRDVLQTLQPLAEKRGVTLELEAAGDLPDAWIDIIQMKRVLHNLLSNAISYSRRNTPIRVGVQPDFEPGREGSLLIEVTNEGKGISAEELPKVFDKYHSASRKFKQIGIGLGLYTARRIVELHGGKIWATSVPEQITRFFVSLPCLQSLGSAQILPAEVSTGKV
jgi:signal transduction histidine kinase